MKALWHWRAARRKNPERHWVNGEIEMMKRRQPRARKFIDHELPLEVDHHCAGWHAVILYANYDIILNTPP